MREDFTGHGDPRTDSIPPFEDEVPPQRPAAARPADGIPITDVPGSADVPPEQPETVPSRFPLRMPARSRLAPRSRLALIPEDAGAVLFGDADVDRFRGQWRELQAEFVDDPMTAVQSADRLVGDVLRSLSETFAAHKHELETSGRAAVRARPRSSGWPCAATGRSSTSSSTPSRHVHTSNIGPPEPMFDVC